MSTVDSELVCSFSCLTYIELCITVIMTLHTEHHITEHSVLAQSSISQTAVAIATITMIHFSFYLIESSQNTKTPQKYNNLFKRVCLTKRSCKHFTSVKNVTSLFAKILNVC